MAVVAFARAHYLRRCLASLLAVQGIDRTLVTVYQDGHEQTVAQVVRDLSLRLVQHPRTLEGEAAAHIARHYGAMLQDAFDAYPRAPYIVIVEEDLVFSPDFLLYFARMAPAMDADTSLLAVSAYNDNGLAPIASNACQVYRSEWFPGLGWLASRTLFVGEFLPKWPETHWDHWLRADEQRRGRECLFPEVSRDKHIGEEGANMDPATFRRYDGHLVLNDVALTALPEASALVQAAYERELAMAISGGRVVRDLAELVSIFGKQTAGYAMSTCVSCLAARALVVYYGAGMSAEEANVDGRINAHSPWKPVSNFFGLWHEPRRGRHKGLHRFHYSGECIMLIDAASSYAAAHMPADLTPFQGQTFGRALWERMSLSSSFLPELSSESRKLPRGAIR